MLLYGQAAIEVRNHDGHTTSCGGQYIEFTLLAQLSDVPKQTPLAIVAGLFDGNRRLSFVTEGRFFWCFGSCCRHKTCDFLWSFGVTISPLLFSLFFSSSDQLGDQIRVISPYKPSICAGPVRVNIETDLREFMRIDMGRWGENESE